MLIRLFQLATTGSGWVRATIQLHARKRTNGGQKITR